MSDKFTHAMNLIMEELEAARQEAKKKCEGALKNAFKDFFEAYPEITAIAWNQYTPSWNDGEPCYFRLGGMHYSIEKNIDFESITSASSFEDETYYNKKEKSEGERISPDRRKHLKEAFRAFERSLGKLEEMFEWTFGDDVFIIATPKGFHVSEYEDHK